MCKVEQLYTRLAQSSAFLAAAQATGKAAESKGVEATPCQTLCCGALRLMRCATFITILALGFGSVSAQTEGPTNLMAQLGCANCHPDLPPATPWTLPDLRTAGLRFQPAYLFHFLQNPVRVRRHLGPARMPNFRLTPDEAAALVSFLETQRGPVEPALPASFADSLAGPVQAVSPAAFQEVGPQLCLGCHTLLGTGAPKAAELSEIGYRLNPAWVREFMAQPERYGIAQATMPALLSPTQTTQDSEAAARRIRTLADYLFGLGKTRREELEQAFALAANPDVVRGEKLFIALNCAGCHSHTAPKPPAGAHAPELATVARTTQASWLREFLKQPHALRPAGSQPGDGSRMPDFGLSWEEVDRVMSELDGLGAEVTPYVTRRLSAFARNKAHLLLTQKLSCVGCHRLGQGGGRLGPDLTEVGRRRTPGYIRDMVTDPRTHREGTIMPRIRMPEATSELIISYLAEQTARAQHSAYLSPLEYELPLIGGDAKTAPPYLRYCAGCHGAGGGGDGFNARFLPVRPTAHADAAYLRLRPDDTLFDGISGGGTILNRSHLMPPWGGTFDASEMKALVEHLRKLCDCEPPTWSVQ